MAAGAHSKRLLADAGFAILINPPRVQVLVTDPIEAHGSADSESTVPMAWDAAESFYFRPFGGGVLVGDGTEEAEFDPDDYDETADPEFREASRRRIREVLRLVNVLFG
ncbi:MAG: FAD-dependent oxidoreductase [Halolamina sp.]